MQTTNEKIKLKYINYEYLLYKKLFRDQIPRATLKSLYEVDPFTYDKQSTRAHFEILYASILESTKKSKSPLLEQIISDFIEILSDESNTIDLGTRKGNKCSPEKGPIEPHQKFRIFEVSEVELEDNTPQVNDRYNPENPKDKPFITSLFTMIKNAKTEGKEELIKPKKSEMRTGLQAVNEFVLNFIEFNNQLSKSFEELDEIFQKFLVCFLYCVLYKDQFYNLFVNKSTNVKKIKYIWNKFGEFREGNFEILLFKYKKAENDKKMEKKICTKNPKLVKILEAVHSEDIGNFRLNSQICFNTI